MNIYDKFSGLFFVKLVNTIPVYSYYDGWQINITDWLHFSLIIILSYLFKGTDGCDLEKAETFPNIGYSLKGYNVIKGYPLADGRDPGFSRTVFAADYTSGKTTADCR